MIHDPAPTVPAVKPRQIVGPHQPDKMHPRIQRHQALQGIGGVAGPQQHLQIGDDDPRMVHHRPCPRQTVCHRRRSLIFQRIAGGHQPPDPVQPERLERFTGDMHMACMSRIKRSAQQADGHTGRCDGKALAHGSPVSPFDPGGGVAKSGNCPPCVRQSTLPLPASLTR